MLNPSASTGHEFADVARRAPRGGRHVAGAARQARSGRGTAGASSARTNLGLRLFNNFPGTL